MHTVTKSNAKTGKVCIGRIDRCTERHVKLSGPRSFRRGPLRATTLAAKAVETLARSLSTLDELSDDEADDGDDEAPPHATVGGTTLGGEPFFARIVG